SQTVVELSRRTIRAVEAPGGLAPALAFVRLVYGAPLAERLRDRARPEGQPEVTVQPPDLLAALTPVVDALDELGVAYRLGGSVASSAHGLPRSTVDIDLVAELVPEHVAGLVARLRDSYYIEPDAVRRAIATRSSFNVIHLATMLKVDVFVPKGRPFDREAARRAAPHPLEEAPAARAFVIASPEDVILAKLEWYRAGGEVSERQWYDVLGVLRVKGPALDFAYLERWAAELDVGDLLRRARAEAGAAAE
ncbi:MAG: hypothetical protein ACRELA_10330, partial [Candidatus Rokuibacteriota bacterium]